MLVMSANMPLVLSRKEFKLEGMLHSSSQRIWLNASAPTKHILKVEASASVALRSASIQVSLAWTPRVSTLTRSISNTS